MSRVQKRRIRKIPNTFDRFGWARRKAGRKCSDSRESKSKTKPTPAEFMSFSHTSTHKCLSFCASETLLKRVNSLIYGDTYRCRMEEGYPRLSFHLSYTSTSKPRAGCIRVHICMWCCSQRNGLGHWPSGQTEARQGPHSETTQNLSKPKTHRQQSGV